MEDKKLLKIAVIIELYGIAMCLLFGLLYALTGTFQSYHLDFLGITEVDVIAFNPKLMVLIESFIRIIGFSLLGLSVVWLYLIVKPLAKGDKVAWFINLIAYLLVVLSLTIITGIIGGLAFYVTITILIGDAIAIVLSLKPCLVKKNESK